MKKINFFLSLKIQLLLFCIIVFLPILYIINYLYQQHTGQLLEQELRSKLLNITLIAADKFNIQDIIKIQETKRFDSQDYKKVKKEILDLKKEIENVKNISIIVKVNNEDAFYLTDSSDKTQDINKDGILSENEKLILIGSEPFQTKIDSESGLEQGFNSASISPVTFTDITGTWIRAYSPINGSNNQLSVVLTIDMYTNSISEKHNKSVKIFQNTIIISFLIVLILFVLASFIFLSPIKRLKEKVYKLKNGDFDNDLKSSWLYGEIGELVENINEMSHNIKKYYEKAESIKEDVLEKQKLIESANQQIKSKNYQLNNTIVTLNSINVLVEELISIKDTKELMETLLPSTIKLVNASKGLIIEYLPEQNEFCVMTCINTENIYEDTRIKPDDGIYLKKIFETKNYVNVSNPGKIKDEEFENALIYPLMVEDELKGAMYIMNKNNCKVGENYFIETDESTVRTLSKLVAAVWESIHLFELATIDSLSKLYVRRYLEKNLEEEIKRAARNETEIGIMMIDIDNLQKCNDNYGHFVGDQVIKQISEQIKENIDELALPARYGGEKLVVYIPEKSLEETTELAENLRAIVENMEIQVPIGDNLKVTVSIGVASFPDNGENIEDLIRSVEESLYKAKREGKNRVVFSKT